MKDNRKYERHAESLKMVVKSTEGDARTLVTSDVGEGGIYFLATRGESLPVGTEIIITPLQSADRTSPPPSIKGIVVHVSDDGMGIEFLEPSFS